MIALLCIKPPLFQGGCVRMTLWVFLGPFTSTVPVRAALIQQGRRDWAGQKFWGGGCALYCFLCLTVVSPLASVCLFIDRKVPMVFLGH